MIIGSEYQDNAVRRKVGHFVPEAGAEPNSKGRVAHFETLLVLAVVKAQAEGAVDAKDYLFQLLVGMFSSGCPFVAQAIYIIDALDSERHIFQALGYYQAPVRPVIV